MTAYYNEIEPYAANWLKKLIAAGLIPAGDVDSRSIVDVRGDDLRGYTQAHFFAGIGLWAYAMRLAGWPDDAAAWTGSCPCQPFSGIAGADRGSFDDARHLWPTWHGLIGECRPPIVFGEQVASGDGPKWLAGVRVDLEVSGYAVGSADIAACGVGSPQKRERLWFVAVGQPEGERRRESIELIPAPQGRGQNSRQSSWADARTLGRDGRTRRSVTPSPVVGHGYPSRVARMRAIGNAIVPQVAAAFIVAAAGAINETR